MSNLHRCYAAVDTFDGGTLKVPVSDRTDYPTAVAYHETLYGRQWKPWPATSSPLQQVGAYDRGVSYPGWSVLGWPVRYFAVRSADDPNWPADAPTRAAADLRA